MRSKLRWLSLALVATLATVGPGMSAVADTQTEADFLAEINASRSANGLNSLTVDGGLRSHARKHTQDMMDADTLYHSSASELTAAGGSGWTKIGENVGRGSTVPTLHNAFMESPTHRENVLGEYNYVGIGTGFKDGVLYVTVVFMNKPGAEPTTTTTAPPATTTTAAKSSPSTTQPKAPVTTTTTIAATTTTTVPVTTTTLDVGPDHPVTPGESCLSATRFWWMCHD